MLQSMGSQRVEHDLKDWTITTTPSSGEIGLITVSGAKIPYATQCSRKKNQPRKRKSLEEPSVEILSSPHEMIQTFNSSNNDRQHARSISNPQSSSEPGVQSFYSGSVTQKRSDMADLSYLVSGLSDVKLMSSVTKALCKKLAFISQYIPKTQKLTPGSLARVKPFFGTCRF